MIKFLLLFSLIVLSCGEEKNTEGPKEDQYLNQKDPQILIFCIVPPEITHFIPVGVITSVDNVDSCNLTANGVLIKEGGWNWGGIWPEEDTNYTISCTGNGKTVTADASLKYSPEKFEGWMPGAWDPSDFEECDEREMNN